jgi:hypothetical protein
MKWFPIGPDFVFSPRNPDYKRLSRRNEPARQTRVEQIVLDPTDDDIIYIAARTWWGGDAAFRSRDGGQSWQLISQDLQQQNSFCDPRCLAVNPDHPEIVYLGTALDGGLYVSNYYGEPGTWSARNAVGGQVIKLIVDPFTSANPQTTRLYAATDTGVWRSDNGGTTWQKVLSGNINSLAIHFADGGKTSYFYAGVEWQGVYLATTSPNQSSDWTNLNTGGDKLPAYNSHPTTDQSHPEGNFRMVLVDCCLRNPACAYVCYIKTVCDANGQNYRWVFGNLYTCSDPTTKWSQVPLTPPPGGDGEIRCVCYARVFAVSPNSPGDGAGNDILFFGGFSLFRSIDSGKTWQDARLDGNDFWENVHGDVHTFAFAPLDAAVPCMYHGDDGGIVMSATATDPAIKIEKIPAHSNEGLPYDPALSGWQNLNHRRFSSTLMQYASDPAISAVGYITCQDTGFAGGCGTLLWRGIGGADTSVIAAVRGDSGVKVWLSENWGGIPELGTITNFFVDKGDHNYNWVNVQLNGGPIASASNHIIDADGTCLTGCINKAHQCYVVRLNDAVATPVSQEFYQSGGGRVFLIARSPGQPDPLYCATYADNDDHLSIHWAPSDGVLPGTYKLWKTDSSKNASSSTVWQEITAGKPQDSPTFHCSIASICVDAGGNAYVLLDHPDPATNTPLFRIDGDSWVSQACSGLPFEIKRPDFDDWNWFNFCDRYRKLVAHPITSGVLYSAYGKRVCRLALNSSAIWEWTDISENLPGQWVNDLWIGDISAGGLGTIADMPHKVILRAAVITSGVWETDLSEATGAVRHPYLRKNVLDQGWLGVCPENLPDPYEPTNTVWHYQCADIKLDVQNPGDDTTAPFFQTEPEGTLPISHVLFDQLKDNSQNLPGAALAYVHVQVHNRSYKPANVRVWVIGCRASAGVPALSTRQNGGSFDFWKQFASTGEIIPDLPADCNWESIGPPQTLHGIDAANPQVASWPWVIPTVDSADPGHYCLVAFVHSAENPLTEKDVNVDALSPVNPRIGQKNLHIGPPLPASGSAAANAQTDAGSSYPQMSEIIEFHNPGSTEREATLVFDLRRLPPELQVHFKLTPLRTVNALSSSLSGINRIISPSQEQRVLGLLQLLLRWLGLVLQWLGCWIGNLGRWLLRLPLCPCPFKLKKRSPRFLSTVYECTPSSLVKVAGVQLTGYGWAAAHITIRNAGQLQPGAEFRFDVQQQVTNRIVGGSTYVVRIAGSKEVIRDPTGFVNECVERIANLRPDNK